MSRLLNLPYALLFAAATLVNSYSVHAAVPGGYNLPEPANKLAQSMFDFHSYWLLPIVFGISAFVLALLVYTCYRFSEHRNPVPSKTTHNAYLEIIWTLVPVLILLIIVAPSLRILQGTDDLSNAEMTIKTTGFQWYWNYAYVDEGELAFDSILIPDDQIKDGQLRLMSVDQPLVIPANTKIKLQFTAGDVIHSWAVQDFGVRMDAVPGLLNEFPLEPVKKPGIYYGFCSELCGSKHSYMPIEVHVLPKDKFKSWLEEAKKSFDLGNPISTPQTFSHAQETTSQSQG
jgi:cytochrome c oxidase subunit 2